ncbi:MAG: TonB-dependent receptor plug domain-containing protein, partial [Bacteroidetes bacterium]|nr:TonB-dependent receptor plug domain-containing protein [Bacteroidota bacterium]
MLLAFLTAGHALAQDGTITGTVIDEETSEPLPGATITAVGTGQGTATDIDGAYSFQVTPGTYTLRATFVGYEPAEQEVTVEAGAEVQVNFALAVDFSLLDEVVVTGVSVGRPTQKIGFQISKVGAEELQEVPGTDPANALRAKVPGARIVQASGQPGTAPSIRLRGTTTLSGSQEPLIVVDGAITSGGLSSIDTQSIESIEIIKGAAAASLYGSLAGNGVIQIITKRGADAMGTTRVTVRNEAGFSQLANTISLAGTHNRAGRDEDGN